jgi:dienelactone hydrolase
VLEIMRRLAVAVVLICLWRGAAASEQIIVPVDYRGHQIELAGWFDKPGGPGPFPVVIGLHSCSGYYANMYSGSLPGWISFLQQQGYATFKFDSFTARGFSEVCATNAVTAAERAGDVLKAAYLLAGRPDVRPDRIAVIGLSHGGGTAVHVARDYHELRPLRLQLAGRGGKLAASIGVYPGCGHDPFHNPVIVPLLALAGGSDDWTPAARCVELRDAEPGAPISVQVYPGAFHAFDVPGRDHYKLGHRLAYDAAATADAHARVQAFLYQYLH